MYGCIPRRPRTLVPVPLELAAIPDALLNRIGAARSAMNVYSEFAFGSSKGSAAGALQRRLREPFPELLKPHTSFAQRGSGKRILFPQQTEQQMFGADVAMREPLRLFSAVRKHPLAFVAQREIN